jgi:hypothetical protein
MRGALALALTLPLAACSIWLDLDDSRLDASSDPWTDTDTDAPLDHLEDTDMVTDVPEEPCPEVPECDADNQCLDEDPCTDEYCDTECGRCEYPDMDDDNDDYPAEEVGGTDCGGTDCDDHNENIYPGAPGVCNDGLDNDCNGVPDDPVAVQADLDVGDTETYEDSSTSMVWTGSEYGMAWTHSPTSGGGDIWFSVVTMGGSVRVRGQRVTDNGSDHDFRPSLVWTGSEYGLLWAYHAGSTWNLMFIRIPGSGTVDRSSAITLPFEAEGVYRASLAWGDGRYALVWGGQGTSDVDIHFATLDGDGVVDIDAMVAVSALSTTDWPALAWSGSEYGLVYQDTRDHSTGVVEIYFSRLSPTGIDATGGGYRLTESGDQNLEPSIVWTGSEYGVTFLSYSTGPSNVRFTRVSADGSSFSAPPTMVDSAGLGALTYPQIAWNASEYGIVAQSSFPSTAFIRFEAAGTQIGVPIAVGTNDCAAPPSVAWSPGSMQYGVMWLSSDARAYFNRLQLCDNLD